MHILIASNDDFNLTLEVAPRGESASWIVPKGASAGDLCVLSHRQLGLYASGYLETDPVPDEAKAGRYRAVLTQIELLGEALPHSVLLEEFPMWKWPSYPRSYTTVKDELEEEVWELVQSFVESRPVEIDEEVSEEGAARLRIHTVRERDPELALRKKKSVLAATGRLICEACSFDFESAYGEHGAGFCEVHHLRPLAQRIAGEPTRLDELAVVCSNCHRMLHRSGLLDMAELRVLLNLAAEAVTESESRL